MTTEWEVGTPPEERMLADLRRVQQAEAAAARGAQHLDAFQADWFRYIRPGDLDMSWSCDCVLGHLFGSYSDGVERWLELTKPQAYDLGFNCSPDESHRGVSREEDEYYAFLTQAWLAEVAVRMDALA